MVCIQQMFDPCFGLFQMITCVSRHGFFIEQMVYARDLIDHGAIGQYPFKIEIDVGSIRMVHKTFEYVIAKDT